jgi:hypothetical protein
MKNVLTLNGIEAMRLYRIPRMHSGAFIDWMYGVRYLQIADTFVVQGTNTELPLITADGTIGGGAPSGINGDMFFPLNNSLWSTRAQNNLVGPQIALRVAKQRGHWITSFEARGSVTANFESITQKTNLGDHAFSSVVPTITQASPGTMVTLSNPTNLALFNGAGTVNFLGLGSNTHLFRTTVAPIAEFRFQTTYAITSNVGLKFGYTGIFVANIARASNSVDYSGPNLISIKKDNEIFFANGINMGVEINR